MTKERQEKMVFIPVSDLEPSQWPTFEIAKHGHTDCKQMTLSEAFQILEVKAEQIRRDRIANAHLRKKLEDALAPLKVVI